MPTVGFHASHEQLAPGALIDAVVAAEAAGFRAAMCSDISRPGRAARTFWPCVDLARGGAPSDRFAGRCRDGARPAVPPAVIAQAIATLAELFPGRFWAALGSGEALNEHVTGDRWLPKPNGSHDSSSASSPPRAVARRGGDPRRARACGPCARVEPSPTPPTLIGAAVSEETAAIVGSWADGMITVNRPLPELPPGHRRLP